MRRSRMWALAAASSLTAGAIAAWALADERGPRPELGLVTSLPIYWSEAASIAEALEGSGNPHWVRAALEEDYRLVPLDTLEDPELARLDRLVLAQPRPFAPAENVALDNWVRAGGRLVLFADPYLTEHSRFALGDKRRPQDTVLMSPILRRWGLELTFDEDQPSGERHVRFAGVRIPVHLAGSFALAEPGAPARCTLSVGGMIADCAIGEGRALIIADAALLEGERPAGKGSPPVAALVAHAFDPDAG